MRGAMLVSLILVAAAGCRVQDAKKDHVKADEANLRDTSTSVQSGKVAVTTMAELGLSEALALELTPAVKAQGEEIGIDASGKVLHALRERRLRSREACRLRQRLRDSSGARSRVAAQFCQLEAASDGIVFDKKLHFTTTGLQSEQAVKISVWVENQADGRVRVTTCHDDRIKSIVDVEPRGERRSRGNFVFVEDSAAMRVSSEGLFDNRVSNAARSFVATRSYMQLKNEGGGIAEKSAMIINPLGRSVLLHSSAGSFTSHDTGEKISFSLSGAAKIGEKLGTALVSFGNEGAHRAYFDGKGKVLPSLNVRPLIIAAGLWIKPEELLPQTEASFRPAGFPVDAWDCSGTTEIERPDRSEPYAACRIRASFAEEACESDGYGAGRRERLDPSVSKGSVDGFGDVEKADTADTTVASEDDEGEEEAIGDGEPDDE